MDNVFVERLWRSVKYDDSNDQSHELVAELELGQTAYFQFCDEDRPQRALDERPPGKVYRADARAGRSGGGR